MASEQSRKRDQNRYALLCTIQQCGPLRRSELGQRCGIRLSSVTSLVDELFAAGVLRNEQADRPRSPLTFTQTCWHVAVAELAAGSIVFALVGLDGAVSAVSRHALSGAGWSDVRRELLAGLEAVAAKAPGNLLGVGVAMPGIVDSRQGICRYAFNFPDVRDAHLGDAMCAHFGLPAYVENDVRCSLWAGVWFEQLLSQYRHAIYAAITSGVGSSLLINGELHAGATFCAGEIGHLKAGSEGRLCHCGDTDCLESYCSIPALCREVAEAQPEFAGIATARQLASAAQHNTVVATMLDRAMQRLSGVLAPLVAYVDPQVILLGNQAVEFYAAVLPSLRFHLHERLRGTESGKVPVEIVRAPHPVLRGLAGYVLNEAFKSPIWR